MRTRASFFFLPEVPCKQKKKIHYYYNNNNNYCDPSFGTIYKTMRRMDIIGQDSMAFYWSLRLISHLISARHTLAFGLLRSHRLVCALESACQSIVGNY